MKTFFFPISEIRVVSEGNSRISPFKMLELSSKERLLDILLEKESVVSIAIFTLTARRNRASFLRLS
jgi:hypothetical protein